MKISIIVPVYNTEKYLNRCLESIISQSLKEIEIIIINDCSSDNSLEIIKKYIKKDKRIILIDKIKNEGVSAARNSGIEIASGDYILCIDSDDWIESNYLKDMYEIAIKYDADMIITDFYFDYGEKNIIYQFDQYEENKIILNNKKIIKNLASREENGFSCVWNKLVKKEIYLKNNIKFPEKISMGEDLFVVISLVYFSKKIVKLNKAYLHYIQNVNGLTKKPKFSTLVSIYFALQKIEAFLKDKNYDLILEELKFNHLFSWIFLVKPNFEDKLYNKILIEFLNLIEKKHLNKNNEKIIKYYFLFRKIFNPYLSFKLVWKLVNLKKNITFC